MIACEDGRRGGEGGGGVIFCIPSIWCRACVFVCNDMALACAL